jgi:hypothetical protein
MRLAHGLVVLVPLALACAIQTGRDHDHDQQQPPTTQDQPITVVVDTNQTMSNTQGGQGLGVFVTYNAGGHWRVWWTCDTSISGLPCDFDITMSGTSLANSATTFAEQSSDTLDTSTPGELVAHTHTTSSVDSVTFDGAPGADMTVDVTVSGLRDGRFFFFVQNGQVNGNFQGVLSDPLIFEPSTP